MSFDLDYSEFLTRSGNLDAEKLVDLINGIHHRLENLEQAPDKVIERASVALETFAERISRFEGALDSRRVSHGPFTDAVRILVHETRRAYDFLRSADSNAHQLVADSLEHALEPFEAIK